jgi:SAM-dependent MidA family methyltransferase
MLSTLDDALRAEAAAHGGWLPFDAFMELALHHPTQGYYAVPAGPQGPFGGAGDFVTAPMMGPWMAHAMARRFEALAHEAALGSTPSGLSLREFGPGTGQLTADILAVLWSRGVLPERVELIERSGGLQARQQDTLRSVLEALDPAAWSALEPRIVWPARWPDEAASTFDGLALANEVADALPVKRFEWRGPGDVLEWGVVRSSGAGDPAWAWEPRPAQGPLLEAVMTRHAQVSERLGPWRVGHLGEWCPSLQAWASTAVANVRWGEMLFIDYGYERLELDHPDRSGGTLAGHRAHHRIDDPTAWLGSPGDMDLTAHVDFSALAQASRAGGASRVGVQTQAAWLLDQGLLEVAAERLFERGAGAPPTEPARLRELSHLQTLLSDNGMGQRFLALTAVRGR